MLLLVLAVGCGDEPTYTKGEFCDVLGAAMCRRAEQCQAETFNACFQEFKISCCISTMDCGLRKDGDLRARTGECESAMATSSCADVVAGVVPAICLTSR